ncbi:MAG: T9SS type A sorting domain-containing protein [Bacteroidetes bacterium]|nr:T9SS type A sorting domain-containing protein [Bacteroidota bacterium]
MNVIHNPSSYSTFIRDAEIHPFSGIDTITGLKISGSVALKSDSSLVRVIFSDDKGLEYMVFESYPLIASQYNYAFTQQCDETCYLNFFKPYSINIQIIDAALTIDTLQVITNSTGNLDSLQYSYKRIKDTLKIAMININIPRFNLEYSAGDMAFVKEYYSSKKIIFGDKYNLGGYDYYKGGIFSLPWPAERNYCRTNMVKYFDWRNRHGANREGSPYYDFDATGSGWMTKARCQGGCGSCFAFAPVSVLEADINLYFNQHLDLNLSEQDVICNSPGSHGCDGGYSDSVFYYLQSPGVRTEYCFPYMQTGDTDTCDILNDSCNNPDTVVRINGHGSVPMTNTEQIMSKLITKGPQSVVFRPSPGTRHVVALMGYIVDPVDSSMIWIYKDSYGENQGENGFYYARMTIIEDPNFIFTPIFFDSITPPVRKCFDWDDDGYFNWGIGDSLSGCSGLEDCDDSNPYLGPYDPETYYCSCLLPYIPLPDTVTSNTTWTENIGINRDIVIDSSVTLTITDTVFFAPEAKLIVMPGAKVIIDGGTLTKACIEKWQGVEVWGNPDQSQFYDSCQGKVYLSNNGSVQNAITGIITGKKVDGNYVQGYEGGIIIARDAQFLNNNNDIEFRPYQNIHPFDSTNEVNNFSYFAKCTFQTDYLACLDFELPGAHVILNGVKGVGFFGCSFKYIFPTSEANVGALTEENIGIYANDADVWVVPGYEYPDPMYEPCGEGCYKLIPCSFDNLWYGIKAFNSGGNWKFKSDHTFFDNNIAGIYLSGFEQPTIISDTFMMTGSHNIDLQNDPFWGGIYMEDCSGYHIEANQFTGKYDLGGITPHSDYWRIGIYVKNSGTEDNEIYNNTFSHLQGAIVAEGNNRGDTTGLCLKCNDMVSNQNDLLVWEEERANGNLPMGIREYQGADTSLIDAPAGNTFTLYNDPASDGEGYEKYFYDYFNDALNIKYIHHQLSQEILVAPTPENYTSNKIDLIEKEGLIYGKDSSCPSRLGNNNYKSGYDPRLEMTLSKGLINQYRNLLNSLVDGGSTEDLNFDVMTSLPNEALEIRQQLLDESPYLSDTVMKQAIYKEDVLPNAMIRDVFTANPQSAKSQEVLNSLDNRFDPMPDYMMTEIMQGRDYLGAKEVLESRLGYWQQLRARAKNHLIRKFLSDTTILHPYDSLIALYEDEADLQSKYRLAFCYFNNEQAEQALNVLNEIPATYELNTYQTAIHQDFEDYFNVIKMIHDSTWSVQQLDSLSVNTLHEIMNNGYPLINGYARGLLVKGNFINYTEKVYFPPNIKSYPEYHFTPHEVIVEKEDHLKLFPNPAWDYVIVYYNTSEYEINGKLLMFDINGKMIKTMILPDYLNQLTVSLKNLPNGIYMISLYEKDNLIESKKITKVGNK